MLMKELQIQDRKLYYTIFKIETGVKKGYKQ